MRSITATAMVLLLTNISLGEEPKSEPAELAVLKDLVGVWDAEIEFWPEGLDKPMKAKAVETNRPYGKHWIASDLEFADQPVKVHSIIGYDLEKKKLAGFMVDHGPYAAKMSGQYDPKTKTLQWTINAKDLDGKPMIQKTVMTQKTPDLRILTMKSKTGESDELTKSIQIRYVKRKEKD